MKNSLLTILLSIGKRIIYKDIIYYLLAHHHRPHFLLAKTPVFPMLNRNSIQFFHSPITNVHSTSCNSFTVNTKTLEVVQETDIVGNHVILGDRDLIVVVKQSFFSVLNVGLSCTSRKYTRFRKLSPI